jgi:drug/metabolite transporter (DMT)-like permease
VGRPAPTAAPSGYLLVFAAAVLWGILGLFARGALDAGLSALEIAFWRALLAGGAFAPTRPWPGAYGFGAAGRPGAGRPSR